jgi:UDP-glucose:(heptosyl)LPS alpha-1,3-glucosyltransferase
MNIGMAYFEFGGTKGVARAAAELAARIAERGHRVDFHCVQKLRDDSGIRFQHVAALNSFSSFGIASFALMGKRSLRRYQYEVTHSHGNIVGADVVTAHSCHRAGMRVHRAKSLGVADELRLYLERKNYGERRFKKVVAVAEGVKRELMVEYNLSADDVVVIPNGVDLDRFNPRLRETKRDGIRRQLGLRADDCVLLFVANEFERKGLRALISALPILKNESVHLVVLGGNRQMDYANKAIALGVMEYVHFCGEVSDIENYYAAADVFVLPTHYEAFSLATLEAAASGLPLVVTKVNGTEELMEDGVNGLLVARDPDDIADKLRPLSADIVLRKRLGMNARASAERYSWEHVADKTLGLYEQIRR